MNEPLNPPFDRPDETPSHAPGPPKPSSAIRTLSIVTSWLVIVVATTLLVLGNNLASEEPEQQANNPDGGVMKLQAKVLLGQAQAGQASAAYQSSKATLNVGTPFDRMRFSVLANELVGPDEALSVLDSIEDIALRTEYTFSEEEQATLHALRTVYLDYKDGQTQPTSITDDERELITTHLGWFGELALVPDGTPDEAKRDEVLAGTGLVLLGLGLGAMAGIGIGGLGFVGAELLVVLACLKKLRNRVGGPLAYGHVYAETFALWLPVFFALMALGQFVAGKLLADPAKHGLAVTVVMFLASLMVLGWPVLRGVPWKTVRHDIGWRKPDAGVLEPFFGVASYAMALPFLGVGILIVLVLVGITQGGLFGGGAAEAQQTFDPNAMPTHPIVHLVGQHGMWGVAQVYLLASIAAPIVEETMFRGVLYRHLRSLTGRWPIALSIIVGALVNSTIFAVIHPQGLIAAPALIALAVAMTLAREWRGSIWASMIVHGISNGVVMTLLILLMS